MAEFTFAPLTPVAFLDRSALVFGHRCAVIDEGRRFSYAELRQRSTGLAGGLRSAGVQPGDRVGLLCANSHVMLETLYAALYAGAVSVPLNTRLSVGELETICRHAGVSLLVATADNAAVARDVAQLAGFGVVTDSGPGGDYERLVTSAEPVDDPCDDERAVMSISYTSGTSGPPKGVMYHHRGSYLQGLAVMYHRALTERTRYLWTLPQFHCHGWAYVWAVVGAGGTQVCLRKFDAARVWELIDEENITHLSGAPTVLSMIASAAPAGRAAGTSIDADTGGAPPSPALLGRLAGLGMSVTHLYGLTETYGPQVISQWQPEWDGLPADEQATLRARQGVGNIVAGRVRVLHSDGTDVAADGEAVGEIVCRGNNVMLGYYRDQEATGAAVLDGSFRTGDLGVMHPDGYVEIRDRAKDIIISGGENVASVEVERLLDSHPAVLESAVVGRPDDTWGEVVVAFVTLRPGATATSTELTGFARERIAHYKVPRQMHFTELPKTSTGKLRKDQLRARAAELGP
jgi:fatty-acyl-CoA synthase